MKHKYLIDRVNLDWIYCVLTFTEELIPIEDMVELARDEGVEFGQRRDVFNRLVDIGILEKHREGNKFLVKLTSLGREVRELYFKNPNKIPYLLHSLHIVQSFKKDSERYFTTYFYITQILLQYKGKGLKEQFSILINRLEEAFPDETITGIEPTTMGKAIVFLNEIQDEQYSYLDFVDPMLFAYGIQCYIEAKTGDRLGKLLVSTKEREELSVLFLIEPSQFEVMLERANRYSKAFEIRYSTTGFIINNLKEVKL